MAHDEEVARGLRRPRGSTKVVAQADWGNVDAKKVLEAIGAAASKSGALRFGYTRDGGAYAIGVYAGSDYFTDYVRPDEDIEVYLQELTASFRDFTPNTRDTMRPKGNKR